MNHNFDVDIATKYGLTEAILLNNIYFWIEHNRVNEVNYHDGYYWTYNSMRAFTELFPYLSLGKIRNALKHLIDEGILITGNYNKSQYDRTLWYALTDLGYSICQNEQMEEVKIPNQKVENNRPIPDINTDNKTDIKKEGAKSPNAFEKHEKQPCKNFTPPTVEEVREYCEERENGIDAETFIDFYASKGWQIGKNKMKDWKAAVRTWEKRQKPANNPNIDMNFRKLLAENQVIDFGI